MSDSIVDEDYKYVGHYLTPASFAEVALITCSRMKIKRDEVIRLVSEYHADHGGIAGDRDLVNTAKAAKRKLLSSGLMVESSIYGLWDFCITGNEAIYHTAPEKEKNNFVYAYYFPAYKQLAEMRGENSWPIKIGLSTTTIAQRVSMQVGTAMPEKPIMLFEIECDDCAKLERAVHAVLDFRGYKMTESVGNEWFNINPITLKTIMSMMGYDNL